MENITLFKGINDSGLDELLGYLGAKSKVFKKNDVIWKKGEKISDIAFVLVGKVKLTDNKSNITYDIVSDNQTFGVNNLCSGDKVAPFNVIALKQTGVLFISYKKIVSYNSLLAKWQELLIRNLFEIISKENIENKKRLFFLEKKSIREKILALLNYEACKTGKASFSLGLSREDMASYLCVDRSALSRELSNLQKDNIIKYNRNEFTLLH